MCRKLPATFLWKSQKITWYSEGKKQRFSCSVMWWIYKYWWLYSKQLTTKITTMKYYSLKDQIYISLANTFLGILHTAHCIHVAWKMFCLWSTFCRMPSSAPQNVEFLRLDTHTCMFNLFQYQWLKHNLQCCLLQVIAKLPSSATKA